MSFATADIERRLANLIKVGTVEEVDHDKKLARVRFGGNLTTYLPWAVHRAGGDRTWWPHEVGEQVVVLSPSGDLTQGIILFSLYSSSAPAPSSTPGVDRREYKDGAVIQYDRNTHELTASIPGNASITATGNIEASADGSISGTAGEEIRLSAPNIILSAGLIRLAGPMVAAGEAGEVYSAEFWGNLIHKRGNYTNPGGDVLAGAISLRGHTHISNGDGNETDEPS